MRRPHAYHTALLTLLLAACAETTAPELPPAFGVAPGHHVVGSGHVQQVAGLREFTFHAIEKPNGTVGGSFKIVLPNGLFFEADVTCMSVQGTTGWVAGTIRASNAAPVIIGSRSMFYATDGGEGADAVDIVSIAAFNLPAGTDLQFCAERPQILPPLVVTDGNVQVR